jgi:hypothetical protein
MTQMIRVLTLTELLSPYPVGAAFFQDCRRSLDQRNKFFFTNLKYKAGAGNAVPAFYFISAF